MDFLAIMKYWLRLVPNFEHTYLVEISMAILLISDLNRILHPLLIVCLVPDDLPLVTSHMDESECQ